MIRLQEKRFADYFRNQPETGMGYWIATAHQKVGRVFRQVLIDSGYVTKVRGHQAIGAMRAPRYGSTFQYWATNPRGST